MGMVTAVEVREAKTGLGAPYLAEIEDRWQDLLIFSG